MNPPSLPPLTSWALALVACAFAPLALKAQLASNTTHPSVPLPAAVPARPSPTPAVTVSASTDEENEPSPPLDPEPGTPQMTLTDILADDGATFASKDRIAVFTGNVRVTCDKLTVFLNKSASADMPGGADAAAATPAPVSPPPAKATAPVPAATPGSSGGIDHAIAEGHVVIVQERAATQGGEAKRSVGRADWANFDNNTGDMVLKGTPSVQQNENTHSATSPGTVMTLRKDNSLTTVGPSRTIIIQRKGTDLPNSAKGAPGAAQPGQSPAIPGQRAPNSRRTRGGSPSPSPAPGSATASARG